LPFSLPLVEVAESVVSRLDPLLAQLEVKQMMVVVLMQTVAEVDQTDWVEFLTQHWRVDDVVVLMKLGFEATAVASPAPPKRAVAFHGERQSPTFVALQVRLVSAALHVGRQLFAVLEKEDLPDVGAYADFRVLTGAY
jgi:hypothetical protein